MRVPRKRTPWTRDPDSGCWLRGSLTAHVMLTPTDDGWEGGAWSFGHTIADGERFPTLKTARSAADAWLDDT